MSQLLVAKEGLTPLLHTMRLKRGFWTGSLKPVFGRIAADAVADAGHPQPEIPSAEAFETVDYDE